MKTKLLLIFIIVLTLLNVRFYFNAGVPITHDGENHLARFANYKIALREKQFPPRFAPNLVNNYGYPVFNYNYPLANILSVPFSLIKLPYTVTFKVLMTISVLASLVGIVMWFKWLGLSSSATAMALLTYSLSPYVFNSLMVRGSIGEVMAMALLIWLLAGVEYWRQFKVERLTWLVSISVLSAFLLSHNVTVLFGLPLVVLYASWRLPLKIQWQKILALLIVAVGLTLWFWLPALAEKKLIILDGADLSSAFFNHFPTVAQLLISPVKFGYSYPGSIDTLSFQVGLLSLVAVIAGLLMTAIHRKRNDLLWFFLGLSLLCLVGQLVVTQPLWRVLPLAAYIQFPWRLSLFFTIVSLPVIGYVYELAPRWLKNLLFVLIIWQVIALSRFTPVGYINKPNLEYDNFAQSSSTTNENLPKTYTRSLAEPSGFTPEIVGAQGEVALNYWKGTDRSYMLKLPAEAVIIEPTMNFAGWETEIRPVGSEPSFKPSYIFDSISQGRIAYQLPAGEYAVRSRFTQHTWPRLAGNTVSVFSFLLVGLIFIFYSKINAFNR